MKLFLIVFLSIAKNTIRCDSYILSSHFEIVDVIGKVTHFFQNKTISKGRDRCTAKRFRNKCFILKAIEAEVFYVFFWRDDISHRTAHSAVQLDVPSLASRRKNKEAFSCFHHGQERYAIQCPTLYLWFIKRNGSEPQSYHVRWVEIKIKSSDTAWPWGQISDNNEYRRRDAFFAL